MKARRFDSEAERLAHLRRVFERSLTDGVPMAEAERRVDADWARARLAACEARASERQARVEQLRATPIVPPQRGAVGEETHFYWQKGQLA